MRLSHQIPHNRITVIFALSLLLAACATGLNQSSPTQTPPTIAATPNLNSPPTFEISSPPQNVRAAFREVFSQYLNVFGVHLFATEEVLPARFRHAAAVMAEYLDNDQDGQPDNPLIVEHMLSVDAAMVVFADEADEAQVDLFQFEFPEEMALQNLYAEEMHPLFSSSTDFDATLEEVLHLITHAGYARAYPEVWGEAPGTQVALAMDLARGGHFERIPAEYPPDAWYRYDDPTCDYACQIAEYTYWALTSLLDAQNEFGRLTEIEHEWQLNTPEKLIAGDPAIYNLLTDPLYAFPTQIPEGIYTPNG